MEEALKHNIKMSAMSEVIEWFELNAFEGR
jgi:hypothetical protein